MDFGRPETDAAAIEVDGQPILAEQIVADEDVEDVHFFETGWQHIDDGPVGERIVAQLELGKLEAGQTQLRKHGRFGGMKVG